MQSNVVSRIGLPTLAALLLWSTTAQATRLIFDNDDGSLVSAGTLQNYGDNVTTSPEGGFNYEDVGVGRTTPNVTIAYAFAIPYPNQYGDLSNFIYDQSGFGSTGGIVLTLTAAPGYHVILESFHLAGYPSFGANPVAVTDLRVLNGANAPHWQFNGTGSGSITQVGHDVFDAVDFGGTFEAQVLKITFDNPADAIGIDNITFTQVFAPEPGSMAIFGGAVFALASRRRSRRL